MKYALCMIILVLLAGRVHAQPAEPTPEQLYELGQREYDQGHYDAAIGYWMRSYELSHVSELLYNIAQAYRLQGNCKKALENYQKFLALDVTSAKRPLAGQFVKELEPKCGEKPRSTTPVPVTREPARRGRTKKIAGLALGGTGLALVATGAYFGLQASSTADDLTDACRPSCNWLDVRDDDTAGRRAERLQWILVASGTAAVVTGGVLYYLGVRDAREGASPVVITPSGDGAAVSWSMSW